MSKLANTAGTFGRVLKTGSAFATGQVLNGLGQIFLPPAFLHSYGVTKYGEWLALSSGVAWLVTLDFGLGAFVVNQLSLEYFKGNVKRLRELQSVGLRISLGVTAIALLLAAVLLSVIPLNRVLGLNMSRGMACFIALSLVTQTLVGLLWGQLNGTLRAVGFPHRAEGWNQAQRALYFITTFALVITKQPLWMIPLGQTAPFLIMMVFSLGDLRRRVPEALPTLSYWKRSDAKSVLAPSLWFGSFTLSQFLLYEVPILVLNQVVGKEALVIFSLCRTYFGMIRQGLNIVRFALRPEITRLTALQNWTLLSRMYGVFQSLNFAAVFVSAPLALLAAQRFLPLWTKRPDMFAAPLYAAMAFATVMIVGKDTRLDLQYSTNRHERSAAMCLFSYLLFAALSIPAAYVGGAVLLTLLWGLTELAQMILVNRENQALLLHLRLADCLKLAALGGAAVWCALVVSQRLSDNSLLHFLLWFVGAGGMLAAIAFFLFGLSTASKTILESVKRLSSSQNNLAVEF